MDIKSFDAINDQLLEQQAKLTAKAGRLLQHRAGALVQMRHTQADLVRGDNLFRNWRFQTELEQRRIFDNYCGYEHVEPVRGEEAKAAFDRVSADAIRDERGRHRQESQYNGWSSFETWTVSLWMDNDQGSYEHYRELAREKREAKGAERNEYLSKHEADVVALAEALREEFEESSPVAEHASVYADLMSAALAGVDWIELANNVLDGIREEEQT